MQDRVDPVLEEDALPHQAGPVSRPAPQLWRGQVRFPDQGQEIQAQHMRQDPGIHLVRLDFGLGNGDGPGIGGGLEILRQGSLSLYGRRAGLEAPAKLAASGINFGTLALADLYADPGPPQDSNKSRKSRWRRPPIRQPLDIVEGDQIDMSLASFQQPGQPGGMAYGIIQIAQENIFVGHLTSRGLKIVIGGSQDIGEANTLVGGNDPGTNLIVGSMQRDGQMIRCFQVGKLANALRQTYRGDSDMPLTDSQPGSLGGDLKRG